MHSAFHSRQSPASRTLHLSPALLPARLPALSPSRLAAKVVVGRAGRRWDASSVGRSKSPHAMTRQTTAPPYRAKAASPDVPGLDAAWLAGPRDTLPAARARGVQRVEGAVPGGTRDVAARND
ncbi:hypothetical protein E2C01_092155 [Portunus trituberculatus]|uniref:Uncharacterized protein n=1 Tax=Portunus trituberculatus TaxID=210409 RepID=A0A5B7JQM0_PORTR|nr:hypothetical protein [Portunus trituberculatus]